MARGRGSRAYNPVSSEANDNNQSDGLEEDDDDSLQQLSRRVDRAYNRVSSSFDEPHDGVSDPEDSVTIATLGTTEEDDASNDFGLADAEEGYFTLTIMDPAHRKFQVPASPEWTVLDLKQKGFKIHKVAASSQRLIYMGRMLQDSDTLRDVGLTEPKTIIHLFPKPRVVVSTTASQVEETGGASPEDGDSGAHVPRIVLDPREAEQRSSILVLGSAEIMEAQNHVRLLSFLLLIITSMELLALFTIMLGVPQDPPPIPDDTSTPPPTPASLSNDDTYLLPPQQQQVRTWQNSDYIDLAISGVGFYVATLGIKATTENTMRLARQYLVGTVFVGIAWNAFYYYLNVQAEREADEKRVAHSDDDEFGVLPDQDYYIQAMFAILLPAMLWFTCCVRAYQFHGLLQEAEEEAEARIRNEITNLEDHDDGDDDNDGDHELTLRSDEAHGETARIT